MHRLSIVRLFEVSLAKTLFPRAPDKTGNMNFNRLYLNYFLVNISEVCKDKGLLCTSVPFNWSLDKSNDQKAY